MVIKKNIKENTFTLLYTAFVENKSTGKWTHKVQVCVVPGSAVV